MLWLAPDCYYDCWVTIHSEPNMDCHLLLVPMILVVHGVVVVAAVEVIPDWQT